MIGINMVTDSLINPLPTTLSLDVTDLGGKSLDSPEFKQLIVKLYQQLNNMSVNTNYKDTGIYETVERFNDQLWFADPTLIESINTPAQQRPVVRKTINFGTLPNAGAKSVAHGIGMTATYSSTRIFATATDPVAPFSFIPIPFVDVSGFTTAGNTELRVDDTNITIVTTGNATNYTKCYVIFEYITT